ncbi:hypothetical protein B0H12DRAFT_624353 [Mycena haematopus]|nr:hypothetical protein B0H12DRAFT_624353 [Mycena haematopus]
MNLCDGCNHGPEVSYFRFVMNCMYAYVHERFVWDRGPVNTLSSPGSNCVRVRLRRGARNSEILMFLMDFLFQLLLGAATALSAYLCRPRSKCLLDHSACRDFQSTSVLIPAFPHNIGT